MNFGDTERYVKNLFIKGQTIIINGETYIIVESGKPTSPYGEPKTDIYIKIRKNSNYYKCDEHELKISFKKDNADFIENKIKKERAEQILGKNWAKIIIDSIMQIKESFMEKPIIYKSKYKKTEAGAITLGWKFELMNKMSGNLSGQLILSKEQIFNIYAGTQLSSDKRNAIVNGKVIQDSGIANAIVFGESQNFTNAQNVIDSMIFMKDFVNSESGSKIYFACKALNYRTFKRKYDGDRPLCVYIDWNIKNNKLHPEYVFNKPLIIKGNEVAKKLLTSMELLNLRNTDDINESNISSLNYVHF